MLRVYPTDHNYDVVYVALLTIDTDSKHTCIQIYKFTELLCKIIISLTELRMNDLM